MSFDFITHHFSSVVETFDINELLQETPWITGRCTLTSQRPPWCKFPAVFSAYDLFQKLQGVPLSYCQVVKGISCHSTPWSFWKRSYALKTTRKSHWGGLWLVRVHLPVIWGVSWSSLLMSKVSTTEEKWCAIKSKLVTWTSIIRLTWTWSPDCWVDTVIWLVLLVPALLETRGGIVDEGIHWFLCFVVIVQVWWGEIWCLDLHIVGVFLSVFVF